MTTRITSGWREYHSDYRELKGDGFIASLIDPGYMINNCPTEAFVGISGSNGKNYIPSIARIWDNSSLSGESDTTHGVHIYFFDKKGVLLGGEEAGGSHQFAPRSINLERRLQAVKIASDLILERPELILPLHEIVVSL